jgi:hypothetical protein
MPSKLCPHCNQRMYYDFDVKDVVHECNYTTPTLTQEDVLIISPTVVEFGATVTTDTQPGVVMMQGIANKFQGTLAGIEGARFQGVTRRGANAATHRQRQVYTFVEISEKDKK